jgi:hypothetical protein
MSNKTTRADHRPRKKIKGLDLFLSRVPGDISKSDLAWWFLVISAIDGNKVAQELMDVSGTVAYDLDGNQIYPIPERE